MQSFVIFFKFFLVYIVNTGTETCAKNRILIMFGIEVVFDASFD